MLKTQTLFEAYQCFIKKYYGRTVSLETFNKFVEYTKRGETINDVKPILNPTNLYAFGTGVTSAEANAILFQSEDDKQKESK